jgi:tricorn protease-like protein
MAWSPDSLTLAMGDAQGAIHLWDMAKGKVAHSLWSHTGIVHSMAFSPDGRLMASGGSDNIVIIWDLGRLLPQRILKGHTNSVTKVAWSPDGSKVISLSYDDTVVFWDVKTGKKVHTETHDQVMDFDLSPDGKMLALGMFNQIVMVLDAASGEKLRLLEGHTDRLEMVRWSPDGTSLAGRSMDGALLLWDTTTWEQTHMLDQPGYTTYRYFMAWSPDSKIIASSSHKTPINLWDAATGLKLIPVGSAGTLDLAWSPDGKILAAKEWNGVLLWPLTQGAP